MRVSGKGGGQRARRVNACFQSRGGLVLFVFLLIAIPVVGILILIHEIGHFWAARWMGIKIEEFGIGFPPRAITLGVRNGVRYSLNWLPLGGFVRMAGEDDPMVEGGLASAKPWRRIIVLLAGALMNLLLAILLYTGLVMAGQWEIASDQVAIFRVEPDTPAAAAGLQSGDVIAAINGRPVTSFQDMHIETTLNRGHLITLEVDRDGTPLSMELTPRREYPEGQGPIGIGMVYLEEPATIQAVEPDSPGDAAGLRENDVILSVDGQPIENSLQFMQYMDQHLDQTVQVTVQRGAEVLDLSVANESEYEAYPLGLSLVRMEYRRYPLGQALVEGGRQTVEAALLVPRTLGGLFRRSVPVSDLAGPVGITYMAAEVAQTAGFRGLLNLAALISVNFFLVNLFPIPALDGGRIAFALVEWVSGGKRLSPEKEGLIHLIGFVLLLAFVITVTVFDIQRIAGGGMVP